MDCLLMAARSWTWHETFSLSDAPRSRMPARELGIEITALVDPFDRAIGRGFWIDRVPVALEGGARAREAGPHRMASGRIQVHDVEDFDHAEHVRISARIVVGCNRAPSKASGARSARHIAGARAPGRPAREARRVPRRSPSAAGLCLQATGPPPS